jgi:lipopolysaccharide/colanic/teichoic acid biosynthesis glycosyltransferase
VLYRHWVKPIGDWLIAVAALVALFPLLLALALAIAFAMGRPVVFRQKRIGLNGKPFRFVKFRTMTNARNVKGDLLPDADRLTAFGRFLRSTSLDELPQLWNILKGEMSLIGPRPLLPEYLPLYSEHQRRRHEVRPGITGWAQVKGRNALSWQEKFELDVWYADHCCFGLDLKIFTTTFVAVLRRQGISQENQATALPFTGNQ